MAFGALALAFVAGILSILSPCVLPILPIVLGAAASAHRWGPVVLAMGLAVSFVAIGLFVATAARRRTRALFGAGAPTFGVFWGTCRHGDTYRKQLDVWRLAGFELRSKNTGITIEPRRGLRRQNTERFTFSLVPLKGGPREREKSALTHPKLVGKHRPRPDSSANLFDDPFG
jgi:hypothetical protein